MTALSKQVKRCAAMMLAVAVLSVQGVAEEDPFTKVREGFIECGTFDEADKTCEELAQYTLRPDGQFDLVSRQVLQVEPQTVMVYETVAFAENGMICAKMRREDFDLTTFIENGEKAGAERAMVLRLAVRPGLEPIFGKTSCMKVTDHAGKLRAEYFLDGKPLEPPRANPLKWIKPDAGYELIGNAK